MLFLLIFAVHLQILLLVGLIVFCLSLVLGCLVCWKKSQISSVKDKVSVAPPVAPVEPVTVAHNQHPSVSSTASQQLYEDGDALEYPSTFTSPAPSEGELTSLPFANKAQPVSEQNEQATSYFSLRRLSSPLLTAPAYKPIHPTRASLPTLPKLGLLSKTYKDLQRRCTMSGDGRSYNERSRLTRPGVVSSMPEKPIPLAPLKYGSNANCKRPISPKPCLHFTMAFSPEQQILKITVLNLTEMPQKLEDLTVLGILPPLHPCPTQASVRRGLSPEASSLVLVLTVSSEKELQRCELKLVLLAREPQSTTSTALGEVAVECKGRDWRPEHQFHIIKELNLNK